MGDRGLNNVPLLGIPYPNEESRTVCGVFRTQEDKPIFSEKITSLVSFLLSFSFSFYLETHSNHRFYQAECAAGTLFARLEAPINISSKGIFVYN